MAWGWTERLNKVGHQVIGTDLRGHGRSDRPREPAAYGTDNLGKDVLALIDHLGHESVSLIGDSLGSAIALDLLHRVPHRFDPSVLFATGDGLLGHEPFDSSSVFARLANALARETFPDDLPSRESAYWTFASRWVVTAWRHLLRFGRSSRHVLIGKRSRSLCQLSSSAASSTRFSGADPVSRRPFLTLSTSRSLAPITSSCAAMRRRYRPSKSSSPRTSSCTFNLVRPVFEPLARFIIAAGAVKDTRERCDAIHSDNDVATS